MKCLPISKLLAPLSKTTSLESSVELLSLHGFVSQCSSGVYNLLPLGLRVQRNIEKVVRKHLELHDCIELELSALVQPQLWKKSGRLNNSELMFTQDKKHLLAPTAEEQITTLVGNRSYKELPLSLYQITKKFRDELRPRGGLLRTREFLMKDLYTFDATADEAAHSYDRIQKCYQGIFTELGVPYVAAEADSGDMGGSLSHEYHIIDPMGEDSVVTCSGCGYVANIERAVSKGPKEEDGNVKISETDGVKYPSNRVLNPLLVKHAKAVKTDPLVDWTLDPKGTPLVQPEAGDLCIHCSTPLDVKPSIEVGHTFYLGDRYTNKLKAKVFQGTNKPAAMEMGCYGIGITRLVGAIAASTMDEYGLKWPTHLAPFLCCVISPDHALAAKLAQSLCDQGISAVYDDRTKQVGHAMHMARQSGVPYTVVAANSWDKTGKVEILPRSGNGPIKVDPADMAANIRICT